MRLQLLSLIFFTFFLQSFYVNGQAPVVNSGYCKTGGGDFDVVPFVGCGSLTVTIQNKVTGAQNVGYITNYDGVSEPAGLKDVFSETYSQPGTYTIFQGGSKAGVGFTLCKQVKVYERQKVNATLEVCGTIAKVTIINDEIARSYDHLEINWGDGKPSSNWIDGGGLIFTHAYTGPIPPVIIKGIHAPDVTCTGLENVLAATSLNVSFDTIQVRRIEMMPDGRVEMLYNGADKIETETFFSDGNETFKSTGVIKSSAGTNSVSISNLSTETVYKIKLVSSDACGGKINSEEAGTMVLKTTAQKGGNLLEWNRYANAKKFTDYQLLRDKAVIHGFKSIDDLKWVDETAVCGQTYEYQIVALTKLTRSFSAPKSVKMTTAAPEKITQASVSVSGPNVIAADVVLSGEGLTASYNLIVERADLGQQDFTRISGEKNQQVHFEDNSVNTASKSYCYRFSYENSCPLRSEFSDPVCSILLRQSSSDISWNNDSPFTEGIESYHVIQNDLNIGTTEMPVGLATSQTLNLNTQVKSEYSFQVVAHAKTDNLLSFSNVVRYTQQSVLLIPDAFTPNNDNINERFEVKGLFIGSFQMSIFNRWGEVVFQTNDINNSWDGMINGEVAPTGSYVYKAEVTDTSNKAFSKSGAFLLIR
jgi:gliding motility-associated-like protein